MKKYVWLLVLVFVWGCDEDPISPEKPFTSSSYGSSVIKIPSIPSDTISAKRVIYKFSLTITGTNMEPISISQPIGETGAVIRVDRIPAGRNRLFEGRLYGSNGVSYEGKANADIFGGKVTSVSLVLRRTGAAQVEVIIEDMQDPHKFKGCYDIKGIINTIDISDLIIEIPESPNNNFWGYFKKDDKVIGKLSGTVIDGKINADIAIEPMLDMKSSYPKHIEAIYDGYISKDYKAFKGVVRSKDSTYIGSMYGISIQCGVTTHKFNGCYDIGGIINDIDISDLIIDISASSIDNSFKGYFKNGEAKIGKFWGTVTKGEIDATIYIETIVDMKTGKITPIEAVYKGHVTSDYKNFEGEVLSKDKLPIGKMYGESITCTPPLPKKCITETLGGIGSTSCKDTTLWLKYADSQCQNMGRVLGSYTFISNCSNKEPKQPFYEGIVFEACLP